MQKQRQEQFDFFFKIIVIGDSGVGKTNLVSRFVDDTFIIDSKTTLGVQFHHKTLKIDGKLIKNHIWDTAGQQKFMAVTSFFYRGAQGAIIAFDLTRHKTFENINKWLTQIRNSAQPDISIMLIGNKADLGVRDVHDEAIEEYASANKMIYVETSALSGQNVYVAFQLLIKDIYKRFKDYEQPVLNLSTYITDNKQDMRQLTIQRSIEKQKQKTKQQQKNRVELHKPQNIQKKPKTKCCS